MYSIKKKIDFYLKNDCEEYKCEVKLMGKGNPESADAVIARDSRVFIADKLSKKNISQLESRGVQWVELRSELGYKRFGTVLKNLSIPFSRNGDFTDDELNDILNNILKL